MIWDEVKRATNLEKHGLDFVDAWLVYENPQKVTLESKRVKEELRHLDAAYVDSVGLALALIYTMRGDEVRPISFRRASRQERKRYEKAIQD